MRNVTFKMESLVSSSDKIQPEGALPCMVDKSYLEKFHKVIAVQKEHDNLPQRPTQQLFDLD